MATRQEKKGHDVLNLEEMAKAISAAMPAMDATEQRIAINIYRQLAEGRPVTTEAIAQAVGIPAARVEAALNSWPGVFRDGEGRVAGFWGLTITKLEPEYRLQIDGKASFAWCALDTLFIPPLMDKTVGVQATDPVTREQGIAGGGSRRSARADTTGRGCFDGDPRRALRLRRHRKLLPPGALLRFGGKRQALGSQARGHDATYRGRGL